MKAPIKFNNFVKLFKSGTVGSTLENGTIYYNTDTDKVILVENGQEVDTVSSEQLENHTSDHNNPHQVTKAQVGLDRVDNTNDAEKPISDATQVALNLKANQITTYTKVQVDNLVSAVNTSLSNHENDLNNPHQVTKAQVGLGNVNNTSDLSKPISTATQTALDLKANQTTTYTKTETDDLINTVESDLIAHATNLSNPHAVTKAQVGLGNVDNTSDLDKVVSNATQTALNLKANQATTYTKTEVNALVTAVDSDLDTHVANTSNPHNVTKSQVGLSNVDNTSDINKPISTATQTALDLKANQSTTYTKTEVDNKDTNLQTQITTLSNTKANNLNDSGTGSTLIVNGAAGTVKKVAVNNGLSISTDATTVTLGLSTYYTKSSTTTVSLGTSFVSLSLSLTPAAGTYLACFSGSILTQGGTCESRLTVGGTAVADSLRISQCDTPLLSATRSDGGASSIMIPITVNGSQAVDVQARRNSASSGDARNRTLTLIRIG